MPVTFPMLLATLAGCVVVHDDRCASAAACGSAEICGPSGTCEPAVDRTWRIVMTGASVAETYANGDAWDPDQSPPDLYVEFGFDGGEGCFTSTVPESYDPVWDEECHFYVPPDSVFLVNLWDDDADQDEFAVGVYWEGTGEFTTIARDWGAPLAVDDPTGTATFFLELWPE